MRQMFNEAQKAEIVAEAKVRPQREIAEERGCSQSTISRITTEEKLKQSSGHRMEDIQMGNTPMYKTTTTTDTVTVSAGKITITHKVTESTPTTTSTHAPMSTIYPPAVNVLQQQAQQNMLPAMN